MMPCFVTFCHTELPTACTLIGVFGLISHSPQLKKVNKNTVKGCWLKLRELKYYYK